MKKFLFIIIVIVLVSGITWFVCNSRKEICQQSNNNEPNKISKKFMFKKITPNIMVTDVNATVDYYKNNLDFQIVMGVDEQKEVKMGDSATGSILTWAMIKKDDVEIMVQRKDGFIEELPELKDIKIGGTFAMYMSVQDVKGFYDKIKDKVEITKDMHKTFYGADEFVIKDLNGYIIYFAEAQNG